MMRPVRFFSILGFALLFLQPDARAESRWEKEISFFEEQDKESAPPKGQILFLGSSSIRMWDLKKSFPDHVTINRGFGGSQISDSLEFVERIVFPYKPSTIVFYAGDNDIASDKTPEVVASDFERFFETVREKLPDTKVVFLSIKPSISRWELFGKMDEANRKIRAYSEKQVGLEFVDVGAPMMTDEGEPNKALFLADGLHLNVEGYRLWAGLVKPHLQEKE